MRTSVYNGSPAARGPHGARRRPVLAPAVDRGGHLRVAAAFDVDMELRQLVRGRVDWPDIERVVRELADRGDRDGMRVRFLDADNWLSTPRVVDDDLFVKVITRQNTLVHTLFTTGRNLGAALEGRQRAGGLAAGQGARRQHPGAGRGAGGRRPRRRRLGVPP